MYVYGGAETDFTTGGLGTVLPSDAKVYEARNGELRLTLTVPIDADGRWRKLEAERIVLAYMPIEPSHSDVFVATKDTIYRVTTTCKLRAWDASDAVAMALLSVGRKCVRLGSGAAARYEVITDLGEHGWLPSEALTVDHVCDDAVSEMKAGAPLDRLQPFRLKRLESNDGSITVTGNHLSDDLRHTLITLYKAEGMTGAGAALGIGSSTIYPHNYRVRSDMTSLNNTANVTFGATSVFDAIFGAEGLIETWGGSVCRDWYDIYVLEARGADRGVTIRTGKNLETFGATDSDEDVATRVVPVGTDIEGEPLYLPELYLESPVVDAYPLPMYRIIDVSEAKLDENSNVNRAYDIMRAESQKALTAGCDLPSVSLDINFVALRTTAEYQNIAPLENIWPWDTVRVHQTRINYDVSIDLCEYSYDAISRRYDGVMLGSLPDDMVALQRALKRLKTRQGNNRVYRPEDGNPTEWKMLRPTSTETMMKTPPGGWVAAPEFAQTSEHFGSFVRARFPALTTLPTSITDARTISFSFRLAGVFISTAECAVYITSDASANTGDEVLAEWKIGAGAQRTYTCDLTAMKDRIVGYTTDWYIILKATDGSVSIAGKDTAYAPYLRIIHNMDASAQTMSE